MSDQLITSIVTVLTAIIGVAIIAILVSRQSQTSQVLSAGGSAFSKVLGTALSPVVGGSGFGNINFGIGDPFGGGINVGL